MGVEIVADHLPARGRRTARQQVLQKAGVILLGALLADEAVHLAGGDVEGGDQALGAVADVFELVAGDLPPPHPHGGRASPPPPPPPHPLPPSPPPHLPPP